MRPPRTSEAAAPFHPRSRRVFKTSPSSLFFYYFPLLFFFATADRNLGRCAERALKLPFNIRLPAPPAAPAPTVLF